MVLALEELSAHLDTQVQSIDSFVLSSSKNEIDFLLASFDRTGVLLVSLGSLSLLAAIWFAYRLSHGISRPLIQASEMLKSLEDGEFDKRLKLIRNDEIGEMANALDGFAVTLEAAMTAVVCSIIDREQARLKLDQQLAEKNAILAGFDGYIYVCSQDKRIEFMNEKLINRTGRDATGEYCYKALHDLDDVCDWCPNVNLEPGIPYHWEIQSPKDDRWYSIINNMIVFPDAQTRKLSMIRDITESKLAVQELKSSEERYRQLFENTPLSMWLIDIESLRYLDVNRTAIEKYGYTREEFLNMTVLEICQAEDNNPFKKDTDGARGFYQHSDVGRHQCKNGQIIEVEVVTKDVPFEGRFARLVTVNDVTEQNLLRRETEQAARLASIGELAAGMAHEINNPTGMILMNLDLFSDVHEDLAPLLDELYQQDSTLQLGRIPYPVLRDKLPFLLKEMTSGGQRIKRIVEDLKGFARKDADSGQEDVDLNEVAQAAIRLVDYQLTKVAGDFIVRLADDLPQVKGHFRRIEQVIINLLVNSAQALEGKSKTISLSTRLSSDGCWVCVDVEDDGRGISPQDLGRVTDPFFTTRRNDGGTGLGLSLSARIAKEHGGFLKIDSTLGVGTLVSLRLPIPGRHDESASLPQVTDPAG